MLNFSDTWGWENLGEGFYLNSILLKETRNKSINTIIADNIFKFGYPLPVKEKNSAKLNLLLDKGSSHSQCMVKCVLGNDVWKRCPQ